jgi:hypothetical protein
VIATTWDSLDDIARQTHGSIDRPARPLLEFMAAEGIEHYELVGAPFPVLVAPPDAVVRVARMAIRPHREEEFYAAVRDGLRDVGPSGNLLAYHLGRRAENGHRAAAVSVWRSVDALGQLVAPETGAPLWAQSLEPLIEAFTVEHYDRVVVRPV